LKTTLTGTLTDVAPNGEGKTFTVKGDGTVAVSVPPRSARVLVRK
jgi:hypothetical protein